MTTELIAAISAAGGIGSVAAYVRYRVSRAARMRAPKVVAQRLTSDSDVRGLIT